MPLKIVYHFFHKKKIVQISMRRVQKQILILTDVHIATKK